MRGNAPEICRRVQAASETVAGSEDGHEKKSRVSYPSLPQQVVTALALYLPASELYPLLHTLPPPDATNPDATTTFATQSALQNSLPIVQEIVEILEKYEDTTFAQEVDNRRKRLGAPSPEVIRQEVGLEVLNESQVPTSPISPEFQLTSTW